LSAGAVHVSTLQLASLTTDSLPFASRVVSRHTSAIDCWDSRLSVMTYYVSSRSQQYVFQDFSFFGGRGVLEKLGVQALSQYD